MQPPPVPDFQKRIVIALFATIFVLVLAGMMGWWK